MLLQLELPEPGFLRRAYSGFNNMPSGGQNALNPSTLTPLNPKHLNPKLLNPKLLNPKPYITPHIAPKRGLGSGPTVSGCLKLETYTNFLTSQERSRPLNSSPSRASLKSGAHCPRVDVVLVDDVRVAVTLVEDVAVVLALLGVSREYGNIF